MIDRIVLVNSNLIVITYFDKHSVHLRTQDGRVMDLLWLIIGNPTQDANECTTILKAS